MTRRGWPYGEILPDERGVRVAGFLRRAARWFAEQGVTIERVMTDGTLAPGISEPDPTRHAPNVALG